MEKYQKIIHILDDLKLTIATMESCTGGSVASEITNHPGASEILKFSAVTYSNEYKIKMGVSADVIEKYSVYSMETAIEMAKRISEFALSDIGIGVTGKFNTPDPANERGCDDSIFVAIYDKRIDNYQKMEIKAINDSREANKKRVVDIIGDELLNILEK